MINPQKWIGILAQQIVNATPSKISENLSENSEPTIYYEPLKKMSYNKYQIWRLKIHKESQLKALERYKMSSDGAKIYWLTGPSLRYLIFFLK